MNKLFVVRDRNGSPVAIHQRIDHTDGRKAFVWWSLDLSGKPVRELSGIGVRNLPLFGTQHASRWDHSRPVIVVEGETDVMALAEHGYRAVGTVTGASTCPSPEAFEILRGHRVLLWPDHDQAGVEHMLKVARILGTIAASVHWLSPSGASPGDGAADYLARGLSVDDLILTAVRVPVPPAQTRRRFVAAARPSSDVTTALNERFGMQVVAGRSVKCPMHDDRSPSLTIFADDKRALCHAVSCAWNNGGHGVSAWQIRNGVAS